MNHQLFWLGYDIRAVRNPAKEITRLLLRQAEDDLVLSGLPDVAVVMGDMSQ